MRPTPSIGFGAHWSIRPWLRPGWSPRRRAHSLSTRLPPLRRPRTSRSGCDCWATSEPRLTSAVVALVAQLGPKHAIEHGLLLVAQVLPPKPWGRRAEDPAGAPVLGGKPLERL